MVGGVISLATDWTIVGPIVIVLTGLLILRGAGKLILESIDILLEAAPRHLDAVKDQPGSDGRILWLQTWFVETYAVAHHGLKATPKVLVLSALTPVPPESAYT